MSTVTDSGKHETLTALTVANVLMSLLLVVFAAGFLYVQFAGEPASDSSFTTKYAEEARERLAEHSEVIEQEVMTLASEAVPPITDAVYEQARRDFPKYVNVLEREGEYFLKNIEDIFIRQVKDQYRDYLNAHRQVLLQEFPQYTNQDNVNRVMNEFANTFDRIVERYYLDELRREVEQTQSLWSSIEPMPLPGPNEPSLHEQLADYSSDWTLLAFDEPGVSDSPAGDASR